MNMHCLLCREHVKHSFERSKTTCTEFNSRLDVLSVAARGHSPPHLPQAFQDYFLRAKKLRSANQNLTAPSTDAEDEVAGP